MHEMTFTEFSAAVRDRTLNDFHEKMDEAHASQFALGLGEEAGEVLGKTRALLGFTKRKNVTAQDVADEIGDVLCYADCLAQAFGLRLEDCARDKFNAVSERCGSPVRLRLEST